MIRIIAMAIMFFIGAVPGVPAVQEIVELEGQVDSIVPTPAQYASGRVGLTLIPTFSPSSAQRARVYVTTYWAGNDRVVLQPVELEINKVISPLQGEILTVRVPSKDSRHFWINVERRRE